MKIKMKTLTCGLVKVLTWIRLRCCGMTLKTRLMLENPPLWLYYHNSTKMSGSKCIHSAEKHSLPAITNAWLQLLLLRVAQPVIRFRGQSLFHAGPWWSEFFPLFIINIFIFKLHFVFTCVKNIKPKKLLFCIFDLLETSHNLIHLFATINEGIDCI